MQTIIPAIIPHSTSHLKEALDSISFVSSVQIDLVDGIFASPASWPFEPKGNPSEVADVLVNFDVELDIMAEHSIDVATTWHACGIERFVFHIETDITPEDLTVFKKAHESVIGCAVSNDTPLESLAPYTSVCDFIQCMGIKTIGKQGQPFDERVLTRIEELHTTYPTLPLSIDGSVSEDTLPRLKSAGATRFVVGSALLNATKKEEAYKTLSAHT